MTVEARHKITAARLKQAISRAGIKQQELADLSGLDKSFISHYCSGKFSPSLEKAEKMGKILGVNAAWLMGVDLPDTPSFFKDFEKDMRFREFAQRYAMLSSTEQDSFWTIGEKLFKS